ncbi:RNA polymerase sigma factor [Streptomyces olivaceoviridis]|uniref:RNA polymerase sigma factor n=1 Tax=Streptomyces olivaceoviridis TaxID=1921 RepID=UPI00024BD60B|nr:RNA polymerase ECF-subfamily sigma factor [Streptomyces hygroscopicus subsp. jinggangensis 5008]AGF59950.1 RNA polymerase ECF-subfamily sigma factor [Streptomyces hygroscopicus subsp. jinggangensis TL01]
MGGLREDAGAWEDAALTRAAQAGDVSALALLLERHRPRMRAVALSLLGPGPDVDDVMQEAALVALRRIVDVRDPEAVGPWLRMVVRNHCRGLLRASWRTRSLDEVPPDEVPLPQDGGTPEQVLESHALRDWIWEAVESLSPTLRLPVVLRYFSTGITSYQQIAEACAVPVRTVRSRLHQARAALARTLADTVDCGHEDVLRRTAESWREAHDTLAAAERGEFGKVVRDRYSPGVALLVGGERLGGADLLLAGMDCDLSAGVRQRPRHIVAGRSLVVWEMDLISPADDPDHCPPGVAWIMTLDAGRVDRVSLYHSPRPETPAEPVAA